MINAISVETLRDWLAKDDVVLVDVREPDEYRAGHIAGSLLMPLGSVTADKLPQLAGKKLVIQCKSGGRSAAACAKLMTENPALQPLNLIGGILAWAKAGYEVV